MSIQVDGEPEHQKYLTSFTNSSKVGLKKVKLQSAEWKKIKKECKWEQEIDKKIWWGFNELK